MVSGFNGRQCYHCTKCESDWVSRAVLDKAAKTGQVTIDLDAVLSYSVPKQRGLTCPWCSGVMKTMVVESLDLDVCQDCGGVFFDEGELRALVTDFERTDGGHSVDDMKTFDGPLGILVSVFRLVF